MAERPRDLAARETGLTFTSGEADVDEEIAVHDLDSHRWRFSAAA